jgi:hypothetical protein
MARILSILGRKVFPVTSFYGHDHGFGHAGVFFPDRQELAVAQTACRSSKNTPAQPPGRGKLAETIFKAYFIFPVIRVNVNPP